MKAKKTRRELDELMQKRKGITVQMRSILDRAHVHGKWASTEDQQTYERMETEVMNLRTLIDKETRLLEVEEAMEEPEEGPITPRSARERGEREEDEARSAAVMRGFRAYLEGRMGGVTKEYRDLQADSDTAGGYMVTPQEFAKGIIKFVDNALWIRQKATKETLLTAQSLGAVELTTDPDDSDWTSEIGTGNEDAAMAFGKRELQPHPLAKRIQVSRKLLRTTANRIENLVRDRLGYKNGVAQEKAFLTGTGAGRPLGLFTASAQGVSTSRDVNTGNTATTIGADNLFEVFYSVKPQYQRTGEWVMHRDTVKRVALLKDGNGQYLWQPGIRQGDPDTIKGRPVNQSEYAPNTYTTGLYVYLFGDLSFYWIVDALDMEIQRLDELAARTNQVEYIIRSETDGMPVLEEAFARGALA